MTTTADGSGVVSSACPDRNNKEGEDSACGGEDQLQLAEKVSTPLLSNEFEMQLASGEIVNTLARQDPSKLPEATKTPSPPPHEKNRFKVVKIETAEPFKRGRWTCMDFLDHSINCSATLIKCMDPEDHRRLIEAKINNRWGSPPNSNAEILKPGYLDNLDQIRANIKAAALASKWPPRTPQISKPPQNPAPAVVQQQNQQQRGFGSSVPQTFTSNAANFPQSYYNQPNSIQNNHFGTQASNVVNNTAFITMQSNPNNNNQAYRMQTTPSNFIQQTGQSPIMQPGVFQQPRQPSPNVNYSQTQFTQRCSNAHAPGTRFSVSSVPCSTVVTGAQANNYIQQVPNTIPGQQRFAPSTPVSAFGSQGFMVQGQTYSSQQPVYNNIPIQSQTYAGQLIMTSLPQQSQPQPYTCQPSAVPSQGQTYAGQNVTAQGQTYAGFTASGVPLQPGQTYAGQQLNGQAVFQNPNYVQQTQIRPLLQPHQQQQSIQQNLQQTQVPQTMLQQQPLAQSQVQQPIPPNQNVQPSTQQAQPPQQQQQQQQTQQSQGVQQQQSQIQSRQPQSQPVTSQAVTSTTASGYNPPAPVTTQQSQTTTSTPAVTADSTVKSSDQQKSQSTAGTPSAQQTTANAARTPGQQSPTEMSETDVPALNPANDPDYQPTSNPAEDDSASGASTVAIDNKIEQAMDLVKSHLMFAVREEVEVLKEKIAELMDRINQLEVENSILKAHATPETLAQLATTQATASSVAKPQTIQAQTLPAPPSGSSSATS